MAQGKWLTSDLLSSVAAEAGLPSTYTDDLTANDVLGMATDELLNYLVPNITSARSKFFLKVKDQTTTATAAYDIPSRTIGMRLSDVIFIDSQGNEIRPSEVEYSDPIARTTTTDTSNPPYLYYIRDDKIVFVPTPVAGLTLRLIYFWRPGELIQTTDARMVVSRVTNVLTVASTVPTAWSAVNNQLYDVIRNRPGFRSVVFDSTATCSGTTVTLNSATSTEYGDVSSSSVDGDWVAFAGQSPIPQIPYELISVLRQRTLSRVLKALKDRAGAAEAMEVAQRLEEQAFRLISPRVDDSDQKISPSCNSVRGF